MKDDLKIIKKQYGENMSKLCRELFPTLLESNGLLSGLMLSKFSDNHFLYDDLKEYDLIYDFKNYIYGLIDAGNNNKIISAKSPKELLDEAGYTLYECYDEEDIQSFKKYYEQGEELCTFDDDRLKRCYVFFAVKKNASFIKRDNFKNPKRQDAYGTSVISIQFTRDNSHTLSIKNRYNHTVNNPDSTFSNNLDNIIPGLTSAFENEYGLIQKNENSDLEIPNYVRAKDGKFYKYNHEINNIYYCINNIIIDNFEVKNFNHEKYIVMDYFIVDLVNKIVRMYNESENNSFVASFMDIEKIETLKDNDNKIINFIKDGKTFATVKLDNKNTITEYTNNNLLSIDNSFLDKVYSLKKLCLPSVKCIDNNCLTMNNSIKEIDLPSVEEIGDNFLPNNHCLEKINIPNVKVIGNMFLYENNSIKEIDLPNVVEISDEFLSNDIFLKKINIPNVKKIGNNVLTMNKLIEEINLPNVLEIGDAFLSGNKNLKMINVPNVKKIKAFFLTKSTIKEIKLPNVSEIGLCFMSSNEFLEKIELQNLRYIDYGYLDFNPSMKVKIDEIINENTYGKEK